MKYETKLHRPDTTTSSGATVTYVAAITVIKVPWWKRVLHWAERGGGK